MDTTQDSKGKGKVVDHPPQDMGMDEDEDGSEESADEQEVSCSLHIHSFMIVC